MAKSNDTDLKSLLEGINEGKYQLPDFQRSWVWDDTRIIKLLESLFSGFPMGAIMNLEYGGDELHFKYRLFTGVNTEYKQVVPTGLILDGQQRLTSLYQSLFCTAPVKTCLPTSRDKEIERYYYLDMRKMVDTEGEVINAIRSIPKDKIVTSDIGRKIELDLSTPEQEYKECCFPVNIIFSPIAPMKWMMGFYKYHNNEAEYTDLWDSFMTNVIGPIQNYKIPVIQLEKDTKKEAVCQIFENVNTGGEPLTVFELVTAIYAADNYNLREDWKTIQNEFAKELKINLLKKLQPHYFLQAMSLLVSYQYHLTKDTPVTCKKRDILKLPFEDYIKNHDSLVQGFIDAARFLSHRGIYQTNNIPYEGQLIPLAAIFAFDNTHDKRLNMPNGKDMLEKWYWCGVFGEKYGSATETRFANDIQFFFSWLDGDKQPNTIQDANFNAMRLLSLTTRNSAAYKGIMALITMDEPLDFMTEQKIGIATYIDENTDIHHIYPQAQCENKYPYNRWNSIINKTPIYASTNRSIGGRLPSEYLQTMRNKGLTDEKISEILISHKINPQLLESDDFFAYTKDRASQILDRIEKAMGKSVDGRGSEDIIKEFGEPI